MTEIADRFRRNAGALRPADRRRGARAVGRAVTRVTVGPSATSFATRSMPTASSSDSSAPSSARSRASTTTRPVPSRAARDVIQARLDDPSLAEEEFDGFFGRSTFAEAVDRFVSSDLVVHGWDLARATGQDETIDADEAERVLEGAHGFGDAFRSPQVAGPEVSVPADADVQTRLIAFYGRTPDARGDVRVVLIPSTMGTCGGPDTEPRSPRWYSSSRRASSEPARSPRARRRPDPTSRSRWSRASTPWRGRRNRSADRRRRVEPHAGGRRAPRPRAHHRPARRDRRRRGRRRDGAQLPTRGRVGRRPARPRHGGAPRSAPTRRHRSPGARPPRVARPHVDGSHRRRDHQGADHRTSGRSCAVHSARRGAAHEARCARQRATARVLPTVGSTRSSPHTRRSGISRTQYGLRQEGVSGLSPDGEPDARRLAALADLVRAHGRHHGVQRTARVAAHRTDARP